MGRLGWPFIVVAAIALALPGGAVAAPAGAPEPVFCAQSVLTDPGIVLDYLPPLRRPQEGRLAFAPAVRLARTEQFLAGAGKVGYTLSGPTAGPALKKNWKVSATLASVDSQGRLVKRLGKRSRTATQLIPGRPVGARFGVGAQPAIYRLTVAFHTFAGRKLGTYGFYFRVIDEAADVTLVLDASTYRPGEVVYSQLQNRGPTTPTYGLGYWVEKFNGSGWEEAPENPRNPVPMIALTLPPGTASACERFAIPPTMPPGHYRISRGATSAEFDLVP